MKPIKTKLLVVLAFTILLAAFLSFQALLANAQVTITGTVLDESGSPLPSVKVLLLNPSDTSMVKGGITDGSGMYLLDGISSGSYLLSVSMVGFRRHLIPEFQADQKTVALQPIQL